MKKIEEETFWDLYLSICHRFLLFLQFLIMFSVTLVLYIGGIYMVSIVFLEKMSTLELVSLVLGSLLLTAIGTHIGLHLCKWLQKKNKKSMIPKEANSEHLHLTLPIFLVAGILPLIISIPLWGLKKFIKKTEI